MRTLKLGCATFSYLYACSLEEALRRLASFGFDEIQLSICPPHVWPRELGPADRTELRRLFDRFGLRARCLNQRFADVNLASINPGIRDETIRQIQEDIDLAADLGGEFVVVNPGKPTPLFSPPPEEIWRLSREAIERCVEHGVRRGITCVLENTGYSLCPRAADLARMVREVDSPNCRIHYDVANANLYEPPTEALRTLGPLLASVDLSDNDGETWTHSPVGQGTIDWPGVADALRAVAFNGPSWLEINVYGARTRRCRVP
ncbi:MAG: sugar phosphate isomerase/epimerase family protein [Solirubrobacterales bacterium]